MRGSDPSNYIHFLGARFVVEMLKRQLATDSKLAASAWLFRSCILTTPAVSRISLSKPGGSDDHRKGLWKLSCIAQREVFPHIGCLEGPSRCLRVTSRFAAGSDRVVDTGWQRVARGREHTVEGLLPES
jgi:hypothetical protein